MTRVLIIYPSEIWSAGLESVLWAIGWDVAGRWVDMKQALAAVETSRNDLLIVAKSHFEQAPLHNRKSAICPRYCAKRIIVLEPDATFSARDFVALNVEGLILSSATATEFGDCLAVVNKGGRWIDPEILSLLGKPERSLEDCAELSDREAEIAGLAAEGLSNKEIALLLEVSDGTVKMHMHHILTKFRLASRLELIGQFGRPLVETARSDIVRR